MIQRYGIWGDYSQPPRPWVGQVSPAMESLCHGSEDPRLPADKAEKEGVLIVAFNGQEAIPGPMGANWDAKTPDEFSNSLHILGDTLMKRIYERSRFSSASPSQARGTGECWARLGPIPPPQRRGVTNQDGRPDIRDAGCGFTCSPCPVHSLLVLMLGLVAKGMRMNARIPSTGVKFTVWAQKRSCSRRDPIQPPAAVHGSGKAGTAWIISSTLQLYLLLYRINWSRCCWEGLGLILQSVLSVLFPPPVSHLYRPS